MRVETGFCSRRASLFEGLGNDVYLIGASYGDVQVGASGRNVVISRSTDFGKTWGRPSVLFAGTLLNATGRKSYGCAPTPVIRATDGRIYREFDNTLGINLIMTKEPVTPSTDLLSADSWMETTAAPFVPEKMVPRGYVPPILCRGGRGKCIASGCAAPNCGCNCFTAMEGNVVQAPNGTMFAILRFDGQSNYTYNKAVVFRRERDNANPAGRMIFSQMIDFPSTSSKFTIRKHPHDGHYYTLSTAVTSAAIAGASQCASWNTPNCQKTIAARNHLVLARSSDLVKWHSCETLLTDDTGFGLLDSARFTGFQYVDWVFDRRISSTIHYAVRTGYRGSNTYHNANRLTVKSIQRISWLCSWTDQFSDVGEGWCRPTANFTNAGTGLTTRDCAFRCLQSSRCAAFAMNVQCALYPSFPTNTSGHGGFRCFGKLQGPSDFAPRRSYGQMKLDDDTAKLAIYWKGNNIAHNISLARAVAARGFTHAVLSLNEADNCSAPVHLLCAAGLQSFIDVSQYMRPHSPWTNASAFKAGRTRLQAQVRTMGRCGAGVSEDIEIAAFPKIRYSADGSVIQRSSDFADLDYRIGNVVSPTALWPNFLNWPSRGAHQLADRSRISIQEIQFNLPKVVLDTSTGSNLDPEEGQASTQKKDYRGTMIEFPTADGVQEVAQIFTANTAQLTKLELTIERLGPNHTQDFLVAPLNYFVVGLGSDGQPDMSKPILCAKPAFAAQVTISTPCALLPQELGLGPQHVALYLNPEEANLTIGAQYAVVLQCEGLRKPGGSWFGVQTTQALHKSDLVQLNGSHWTTVPNMALAMKLSTPGLPRSRFRPNQLHSDWVQFQAWMNAMFVKEYRNILGSSGKVMIYSGYADAQYVRWSGNYFGLVDQSYGVNWNMLSEAGLDIAVCGYGVDLSRMDATKTLLRRSSQLVCGCGNLNNCIAGAAPKTTINFTAGQKLFSEIMHVCDGVMEWYAGPFSADPGYSADDDRGAMGLADLKARGDRHNASTATAAPAAVPPEHHGRAQPGVTTIALLDHGAACDGVRTDTEAFVSALAAAGAAVSAGAELVEVHVPSHRTCLTGPFNITSNSTTLFLEEGSTVKAADDPSLWPRGWPLPTFGPHELFSSFVGLYSVRGSGVAGPGSLDMNGGAWHGGRLDPRNDYKNLPKFLTVHDCADVHIRGVSLLNGANWNIHLVFSTNCSVDGVRIVTPFKGTDGIDVDSSTHIQITNVFVHNGDDCTTSISIMIINLD
eukprot:COSAG01_NODE_244_length_20489_cov_21.366748_3_plen_1243_part_00